MARTQFEKLEIYGLAEKLADAVWDTVSGWDAFARDTVGQQLQRAVDSIGANIAEGAGRGSTKDRRRFACIARGSLYETKHWLRRAYQRHLLDREQVEVLRPLIDELSPRLNAFIKALGRRKEQTSTTASEASAPPLNPEAG